jgi:DNA-binding XRE family transcriptional regulator
MANFARPFTLAWLMARPTLVKLPGLLRLRISRGHSQDELATLAGTSRVNVGRIERGGDTHPKMAIKLAKALGCDIDDLMHPTGI